MFEAEGGCSEQNPDYEIENKVFPLGSFRVMKVSDQRAYIRKTGNFGNEKHAGVDEAEESESQPIFRTTKGTNNENGSHKE